MRIALTLATFSAFALLIWPFAGRKATVQKPTAAQTLHVKTRQLDSGPCSIELTCEDAKLIGARIEELVCNIRNKSAKVIVAGTIAKSIIVEENGVDNLVTGYETFDTYLHPDFNADHLHNQVTTGNSYPLYSPPTTFDNGTVKEISVEIDYIEFADKSTCGSNHAGERIVIGMREGASKYKQWLVHRYQRDGITATITLLDRDESADQIGVSNENEMSGASMYRQYLRRVYQSKGSHEVLKRLQN